MDFFTSDWHLNHKKIIELGKRPFNDLDEMNRTIVARADAVLQKDDNLYILGDVAFGSDLELRALFQNLRCKNIHLIRGNHDRVADKCHDLFKSVHDLLEIKSGPTHCQQRLVLCHYAMRVWNQSHRMSWHLYGHSHGTLPDDPHSLSLDVGVDCHNYYPISFNEVAAKMKLKLGYKPVDHHKPDEDRGPTDHS